MDKFLRKLLAICTFAFLAVGLVACSKDDTTPEEPTPDPVVPTVTIQGVDANGEVANAATSWNSASVTVSTEAIVEFAWMLQTAEETAPVSEAIVFKNGTVVTPTTGSTTLEFTDLARTTDYVVYIAAKVAAEEETKAETAFYGEIIKIKFSTPDYSDEITVVKVKQDGFDLHVKFPASVSEKGNSIKWGVTNIALYNQNKMSGASDASLLDLNDGVYPAARFVRDTTLTIDEAHRYAMDENGELILDEWMGEPIYYWDFIAPGEPLVLFMAEVAYGESMWGWGEGWYVLPFDFYAYDEAMWFATGPEDMPNEADFWEEGAWYKKVEVTTLPPAEFEGTVEVATKDLATNGGALTFTPDDKTYCYCVGVFDDATYNDYVDMYLGGNEDYMQWLSTSYIGAYAIGSMTMYADVDEDGVNDAVEMGLLDYFFWELIPGGTYHVIVTAMGSREAQEGEYGDMNNLVPDAMAQNYQHITFELPDYTLDAPELLVTPLEPTSPYEVSFNVKCTNYDVAPVVEVAYAANYVKEFDEELKWGSTYADLCSDNRDYYGIVFSEEEVEAVNTAEGCVITFPSREDATTRLAVMGWNAEGRPSVFEGENPTAVGEAKSGVVPDAEPVDSPLFGALDGEWTATATVMIQKYDQDEDGNWGNHWREAGEISTKVVIGDVTYPETLSDDIYALYEENGVDKEQADAYFAEFKEQAEIYNNKVRGQNRMLCTGWNFDASSYPQYSNLRTATPWDLFTDNSGYNASDVSSIFYDFGAKWFLQVNKEGEVFVPVNANRLSPLTRWTNGTDFHLAGANLDYSYVYYSPLYEEDMDDVSKWPNLPVEVSEDMQTITIKAFEEDGITYYPNAFYNSTWSGLSFYNTVIVSDVVLTKGWNEADEDVDVEAVRKNAAELKQGAKVKSVSNATIEAQSAPKSRSVYFEKKPALHKIEAKALTVEQSIENMKQLFENKKAARK